jgi:uncharacterized protein with ParB-like and HNH nuclease domain/alkylated DNA nucleotide flippase Atl1
MVHAAETNLQKLLEGTKQYQVPLYQRTYSWKNAQLQRLWDDLVKLAEDRFDRGAGATHFIGSLVLAPSPSVGPTGVQEFLVVDGQQRLTTLTLLLAAIRDHRAETEHPNHVERINEKYLINKWEEGQPLKLQPTQADRSAYLSCVRRTATAGGADPVGSAYRFFRAQLSELDDPDDDLDIERLEEAVIAGLSLVCVTAQAGDNVHRIFESLNNTGLRLTQGDLIRNYLFMRLPTRGEHVYQSHWLPLQERLSSQQLELLFWLDLVQSDETAKQTDTYALQQSRLDRIDTEEGIESEVERLARLGKLLEAMLDPAKEEDPAVRQCLTRLNDWGTTTVYPILLHLLERRERGAATNEDLVSAMNYLESFFVRRVVVGKATANINRILLRAVTEIRDVSPVSDALRDYLSTGRKFFASDADIRAAVRTVPFYWSGRAAQRKLVLLWIEETYRSKEPVLADQLSIEHVMPQTATDDWRSMLATGLPADEDLEATYQGLVHTIGNLTLTGYNSELSNSSFQTKRTHLASSGIRMNQEIAQSTVWGRAEIHTRADQLAERIIARWPGPNPTAQDVTAAAVWLNLDPVLAEIPAGAWTSYGDVAAVLGTHPVPLGQRLANHPTVNAHRVLNASGQVAGNFRWTDENRTDDPRDVLEQEGIHFDENGRASASQRLTAEDLAVLTGLETDSDALPGQAGSDSVERHHRFLEQVGEHQPDPVAIALGEVLDAWVHLGGSLGFGRSDETSCFLLTSPTARSPWPFTIYPTGKVEVVFQHMASRPPFDDVQSRHDFRERLDAITGVDLPPSKIELRPGFQLEVLADPAARDAVIEHLAWFIDVCRRHEADASSLT